MRAIFVYFPMFSSNLCRYGWICYLTNRIVLFPGARNLENNKYHACTIASLGFSLAPVFHSDFYGTDRTTDAISSWTHATRWNFIAHFVYACEQNRETNLSKVSANTEVRVYIDRNALCGRMLRWFQPRY